MYQKKGKKEGISLMYKEKELDEKEIYHKTKLLLSIYKKVVWQTLSYNEYTYSNLSIINAELCGNEINTALTYLETFASNEEKELFQTRISALFETKWIIELVDKAMYRVYMYYNNGKLYHELLSKKYLVDVSYTENDLMEIFDLERTTLYRKLNEATFLLGLSLWGYTIPELKTQNTIILSNY